MTEHPATPLGPPLLPFPITAPNPWGVHGIAEEYQLSKQPSPPHCPTPNFNSDTQQKDLIAEHSRNKTCLS